ncbi:hypothetical protein LO762_19275 [Actinocorallia sp. API 0066]|uniref:hypothetical protein n=1 Tax=Actinocorallia sp. API 0066 TaxID=2896846 RepID=UPI001E320347|nr:hypothetical protein [Actinocorallia sp. API 0066]MCD0451323.1 hypothetical protein [Actinocorallia sp. API 0066]
MPRVTLTVTGALLTGAALLAAPGSAAPPEAKPKPPRPEAPPAVLAEGRFRTADGAAAAFRSIGASGRYTITEEAVTVSFTLTDRRRDGWTAGVQFATAEAWDEHHSPVYHPVGRAGEPRPGTVRGGRVEGIEPVDRPRCHGCVVREPRKAANRERPVDGKITYRFPRAFTSEFTEGLWVREVLVKRQGRRTVVRPGPVTRLYRASVGTVHPGPRAARLAPGAPFTGGLPAAERRAVPAGTTPFAGKQFPDAAAEGVPAEVWGTFGRVRERGEPAARLLLRIRDLAADRRHAGVIVTFTDEDGTTTDTWTFWNARDSAGRWTSRLAVNKLSGHLFYRPCAGTQKYTEAGWTYTPTVCGTTRQLY